MDESSLSSVLGSASASSLASDRVLVVSDASGSLEAAPPLTRHTLEALKAMGVAQVLELLKSEEEQEEKEFYSAVVYLGKDLEKAICLQQSTREKKESGGVTRSCSSSFLWCPPGEAAIFLNYPENELEGKKRNYKPRHWDAETVVVGAVSESSDNYLITTTSPHGLSSGSLVSVSDSEYSVQVVSKTEFEARPVGAAPSEPARDSEVWLRDGRPETNVSLCDSLVKPTFINKAEDEEGVQCQMHAGFLQSLGLQDELLKLKENNPGLDLSRQEEPEKSDFLPPALLASLVASHVLNLLTDRYPMRGQWAHFRGTFPRGFLTQPPLHPSSPAKKKPSLLLVGDPKSPLARSLHLRVASERYRYDRVLATHEAPGSEMVSLGSEEEEGAVLARVDCIVTAEGSWEQRAVYGKLSVKYGKPMVDLGAYNLLGHVQTVIPDMTESYGCSRDRDPDGFSTGEAPFCVLKSFPGDAAVAVAWAEYKLRRQFEERPGRVNEALFEDVDVKGKGIKWRADHGQGHPSSLPNCVRSFLPSHSCPDWPACVSLARNKYERYFVHKAKRLLRSFPATDEAFWRFPKRVPAPVVFEDGGEDAERFVAEMAEAYARMWGVEVPSDGTSLGSLRASLAAVSVSPFVDKGKAIVTDESVTREEANNSSSEDMDTGEDEEKIKEILSSAPSTPLSPSSIPASLKSSLLARAARLRCLMYGIRPLPTAAEVEARVQGTCPCPEVVAAPLAELALLETHNLLSGLPRPPLNHHLNLSPPSTLFPSSPVPCARTHLGATSFSLWTSWALEGGSEWRLSDFLEAVGSRLLGGAEGADVSMVVQGAKMVYVQALPMHAARKNKSFLSLLKKPSSSSKEAADSGAILSLMVKSGKPGEEDVSLPPITYTWKK